MKSVIDCAFELAQLKKRKALIPYIMAGYPNLATTEKLVLGLWESEADIIELGIPFSDPIADGPVIQRAAGLALKSGVTLSKVLGLVERLRRKTPVPIVFMTYYNLIYTYGLAEFASSAHSAGVDGVIIPDLTPEEANPFVREARKNFIDTIFLVAPTSTPQRLRLASKLTTGFLYYVSMTGVTGAKFSGINGILGKVKALKTLAKKPVAVGFGISTPAEACSIARAADGVIIGSAVIKAQERGGVKAVGRFIREIRRAI